MASTASSSLFVRALSGTSAITLAGSLIAVAANIATSLINRLLMGSPIGRDLLLLLAANAGELLVLFVGAVGILPWVQRRGLAKGRSRGTVAAALGIYVMAGIVRAGIVPLLFLFSANDGPLPPDLRLSLTVHIPMAVAWLSLLAMLMQASADNRSATMKLEAQRALLREQRDEAESLLSRERQRRSRAVDASVVVKLRSTRARLDALSTRANITLDDVTEVAIDLRSLSESSVRPLSYDLASSAPRLSTELTIRPRSSELDQPFPTAPKFSLQLIRQAVQTPPRPLLIAVVLPLLVLLLLIAVLGPLVAIPTALCIAVATFILETVARQVMGATWIAKSIVRCAVVHSIPLLLICVLTIVLCEVLDGSAEASRVSLILAGVWETAAVVGCLVYAAFDDRRTRAISETSATLALSRWEVKQLDHEVQTQGRYVARMLHSSVQGNLVVASNRLLGTTSLNEVTDEVLRVALNDSIKIVDSTLLDLAPAALTQPANPQLIRAALSEISEAWSLVMPIKLLLSAADADAIDGIPAVASEVLLIVRDALSNASKHGSARSALVEISSTRDAIRIVVTDDGTGPSHQTRSGLGFATLEDSGAVWSFEATGSGSVLTVELPVELVAVNSNA